MKEGALRRSGLGPSLQGGQLLERRQVVAVARGHQSTAHALGGFMISAPLARDQPFVVGGIVPRRHIWR